MGVHTRTRRTLDGTSSPDVFTYQTTTATISAVLSVSSMPLWVASASDTPVRGGENLYAKIDERVLVLQPSEQQAKRLLKEEKEQLKPTFKLEEEEGKRRVYVNKESWRDNNRDW